MSDAAPVVTCPECNAAIGKFADVCPKCGIEITPVEAATEPNVTGDSAMSTLIPYNNPYALLAYYFGIFSLIPCFSLILAPVAIGLGIAGLRHVKGQPQAKGTAHAYIGIGVGAVMLLLNLAVIGMMIVAAATMP
ncbi:MAG: hypothetical protein R3E01_34650 [Pirellulaceae bacterium]|nr:hypothetical protein [Planctomycetales bacterium]